MLLFESAWKLLWFGLVALPQAVAGPMDTDVTRNVFSCSLVVVILAVIPWRYVWRSYLRAEADAWR